MKKFFTLIVLAALCGASNLFAQNQLVATLKHGDTTTLFYGSTALQQAHDAAEDGDVITLSEGVFKAITISKQIIVKGAGMKPNLSKSNKSSQIEQVILSAGVSNILFEGVNILAIYPGEIETSSINFISCMINDLTLFDSSSINWGFKNCIIVSLKTPATGSMFYENCVILAICVGPVDTLHEFKNCIIRLGIGREHESACGMSYSTFQNCIFCNGGICGWFTNLTTIHDCVGIGDNINYDATIDPTSNARVDEYSTIFKTYTGGDYSDSETFELTDEAAATYLGDDGKQVGIYGLSCGRLCCLQFQLRL